MKIFRFLTSKTFWANVLLILLFVALLFWALNLWMDSYTRHGEDLRVPNLSRLDYDEAIKNLAEMELEGVVLDTSEFDPDFPRGSIINQYPEAGAFVKEGREIRLTINPMKPRKIEMPDLKEKTKRRALYDLQSKGFKIGELTYVPYLGKDVVVEVKVNGRPVEPKQKFDKGTPVELVLGKGLDGGRVEMPNLLYLSLREARQKLLEASLNLGSFTLDGFTAGSDTNDALVFRQYPGATNYPSVSIGTEVELWLTTDDTKLPNDSLLIRQREIADSLANEDTP